VCKVKFKGRYKSMHKVSRILILSVFVFVLSLSAVAAQDPVTIDWWHISTQEAEMAY